MKVAMIGAGGYEFPLQLMNDFLSFPSLEGAEFALMDIDGAAAARTARLANRLADRSGRRAQIAPTVSLHDALVDADFVVTCFQVGGREAYGLDMTIPRRYGIDQTVGDTMGPGGIMRGLRTMAALDEITAVMADVCPGALLMNYPNPMSINVSHIAAAGARVIGLCHSVQHTADEIAAVMGIADDEWSFRAAGVNHQAWMLEFRHCGVDVLDRMHAAMRDYNAGRIPDPDDVDAWYAGGREGVRTAIMELVGWFQTESSHHASEYYPHFRRTPEQVAALLPQRWDYFEISSAVTDEEVERQAAEFASSSLETSEEYAARIIDSVITDTPRTVYGNVPNTGLITNLPPQACVEVPVLVDASGIQPTVIGELPAGPAAVNLTSIAFQQTVVEAYRTRSRDLVYLAASLDRLTGALLDLDGIRSMMDELIAAQSAWLPALR